MDFDFDLDLDIFETKETRKYFNISKSIETLSDNIAPPGKEETLRFISPISGFSSCSVVLWIASLYPVADLYCTTLRIGKKELQSICDAIESGDIGKCHFCLCDISKENNRDGKKYDYDDFLTEKAKEYNFEITYKRNHSKIILLDCGEDKFVIETSSNLNENPKIEQFAITNSAELYEWYLKQLKDLEMFK